MRVLVQIPLSTFSGYGQDGIGLTRALMRRGVDVYLLPTAVQAPLPPDVAMLLTKETKGPFDLGIVHLDPMSIDAKPEFKDSCDMLVGWTMWEWSNLRNAPKRTTQRKRFKNFDAMVGYDRVSSAGLAEYFKGPILTQQGGYEPSEWQYMDRDWHSEDFYFCQIGVLSDRKNPFASIAAFGQAKQEDPEFDKHARLMMKAQPLTAPVLTPGGWTKMGELRVGDVVTSPQGGAQTVQGVYPQGVQDIYRVTFSDGSSAECTEDHLWKVRLGSKGRNAWQVRSLKDILAKGLRSPDGCYRWVIPLTAPVQYEEQAPLPLPPYLIGALLGDGSFRSSSPALATVDKQILDRCVSELTAGVQVRRTESSSGVPSYSFVGTTSATRTRQCVWEGCSNSQPKMVRGLCTKHYTRAFRARTLEQFPALGPYITPPSDMGRLARDLGLHNGLSYTKFIPDPYLVASAEDRLNLLRGLMDTDGTVSATQRTSLFSTTSPRLRDDVISLVQSLGGMATYSTVQSTYTYKGEKKQGREAYNVNIRLNVNPFYLRRKAEVWDKHAAAASHDQLRKIAQVEWLRREEAQCILVSGDDHTYVTSDFVVTHNTSVPGLHSKMEDIYDGLRIFYDAWPVETVREFYRSSHVLLAPSRGEGKNMPALEMMSTGGGVIATNWGGHQEWLHPDYAYALDYDLIAQDPKYPNTLNADVHVEHLKNLMLHTFHNREEVKRKGEIAAQIIPAISSWDSVIDRFFEKLTEVPGGVELKMMADIARREKTA